MQFEREIERHTLGLGGVISQADENKHFRMLHTALPFCQMFQTLTCSQKYVCVCVKVCVCVCVCVCVRVCNMSTFETADRKEGPVQHPSVHTVCMHTVSTTTTIYNNKKALPCCQMFLKLRCSQSMCVYMCVCVCVHTYIYTYIHVHTHTYVCMYTHTLLLSLSNTNTHVHTHSQRGAH